MSQVHPTAIVSAEAQIGTDVEIGPFSIVGRCTIGDGSVVHSHVVIADGAEIGAGVEIFPGALLGKEPKAAGATARLPEFERRLRVGDGCSIGPHSILYYDVEVGAGTLIGDGASVREQCRIGAKCIISRYVTLNYHTRVGDGVKVMDGTHLTGNMTVGDGAFVSALVVTLNDNVIRSGFGDHIVGPVVEPGAIVGGGATLMPGTVVGANATVAAGAVVTRSVAADSRVAGVPAKPF